MVNGLTGRRLRRVLALQPSSERDRTFFAPPERLARPWSALPPSWATLAHPAGGTHQRANWTGGSNPLCSAGSAPSGAPTDPGASCLWKSAHREKRMAYPKWGSLGASRSASVMTVAGIGHCITPTCPNLLGRSSSPPTDHKWRFPMSKRMGTFAVLASLMSAVSIGPTMAATIVIPPPAHGSGATGVIPVHSWSQCMESERRFCNRRWGNKDRSREIRCIESEQRRCCNNHDTRSRHNRSGCREVYN